MDGGTTDPRARLVLMSEREFLAAWKRVFGEPPAILLDRAAMVDHLLADGPACLLRRERDRLRVRAQAWAARDDHPAAVRPLRSSRGR